MDAVSDRDYVLEFLFVCSVNAMHLSRFAEEGADKEGIYGVLDAIIKTGSRTAIKISEKI